MVMQAQRQSAMATSQDLRNQSFDDNRNEESGVPACLQWARDLETLLNDDKGCDLFESYLQEEQCDLSELNFIYACTGLRIEAEPVLRDKRARTIYRHYVKNDVINSISDSVKATIKERIDNRHYCSDDIFDVFDDAVKEVKEHVTKTTFARFIQSDLYVNYIQDVFAEILEKRNRLPRQDDIDDDENDNDVSRSSAPAPSDSEDEEYRPSHQMTVNANNDILVNQMPTLNEEDEENSFMPPPPATTMLRRHSKGFQDSAPMPPPLPSKTLQLQKRQSQRGLMFAETIKQHGHRQPPNPYHVKSSSFVPPSAYNSEIQSMSSGGGNYAELELLQDLEIHGESSRRHDSERRKMQRSAFRNVPNRANLQQSVIPRTMFVLDPNSNLARDNPQEFFQILYRKLVVVARERDTTGAEDESNNQSILDNHMDRVFGQTPVRTPGSPPDSSPPLGAAPRKAGHKSPYHLTSGYTRSVNSRKDDNDSAIYMCSSGTSTSVGVPLVQPRKRMGHAADSGCEESMSNATIYSLNENVSEWVNRSCHDSSKSKNKSSVCSGSNRSSKCGQEEKDKKKKSSSSSKEAGIIVGYQYEGEEVPFVIRIPYKQPRLKDFKAQLTKKGHYRYFFKRSTNAFGSKFVFEEVTDDEEELPMCDGKIFARIHPNGQPTQSGSPD